MILKGKKVVIMGVRNKWSIAWGAAKSAYDQGAEVICTCAEENIEGLKNVGEYKTDQANYYIAKFILEENEKNTSIFNSIYKIVCGFMLANESL